MCNGLVQRYDRSGGRPPTGRLPTVGAGDADCIGEVIGVCIISSQVVSSECAVRWETRNKLRGKKEWIISLCPPSTPEAGAKEPAYEVDGKSSFMWYFNMSSARGESFCRCRWKRMDRAGGCASGVP